ncbi:glycine--tRNA ligase [Austwickia sp. TVS 96-490-7B]|uniref:glycine--tRNA ligase n=1 Tax=Austwickia sp. TVS 96-490-7B TaxID=2830843 RepID=UPI001C563773|nr:glycine--tRNA ligase [Austwickia sp. TVS 96-490-7B]
MQDALRKLADYWNDKGCLTVQPFNTEVGAGTMNPATVLRVLGPEPWDVAYVEPSVRPDDSRYGENPNRLQMHTQFQVILKPEPGNPQELYLGSLEALGIDLAAHDVRFVEDNWAQPAIGAWGLGWEVWLDGMEITQFTYFQQVGGHNLDPIPVELTYGMERILMAVQGVNHFADIAYATKADGSVISYGEAFGQNEYEMSRYYLDDADVETSRNLFAAYVAEATRMVEARLPLPAHSFILKCSHAFNVLDSRGAISTTERAKAFATMRRLMRDTATLWIERREELGLPLMRAEEAPTIAAAPHHEGSLPTSAQTLAVEIGLEELPPHVVLDTIDQVRVALTDKLAATRLAHGAIHVDGTPRRIVAVVAEVAAEEPDATRQIKGPKWQAAFAADGTPTRALEGFVRGQKATLDQVVKAEIGGNEHAVVEVAQAGRPALDVLSEVIADVVAGLRAEKNMRWSDPELSFSRAVRWLVALWGPVVVPVRVSALTAGRTTYVLRGAAEPHPQVASADELTGVLRDAGIVLSGEDRRAAVVDQAVALAAGVNGRIDVAAESAVIDEITHLVEQPHGIIGSFDERYLELPERILVTVMRKHQRYLPVRAADGRLMPYFVTMANGDCDDAVVRRGNESVLRARYEDALFFWNADLRTDSVETFVPGLEKLTFENRLGSIGERSRRIKDVAHALADVVSSRGAGLDEAEAATLSRAGQIAKFDLATQMVVEMSSLAGFVAQEYAVRMGETPQVAAALYEMEQPHTQADELPRSLPGALLALADRFDLVMAMFALGAKPTGSSDPYGLRRAALGVLRIMRDRDDLSALTVRDGLSAAATRLREHGVEVADTAIDAAEEFTTARFAQLLRDEGVSAGMVQTILPGAGAPRGVMRTLAALDGLSGDAEFRALVAALQRIDRIVPAGTSATYDAALLVEPAEVALREALEAMPADAGADVALYAQAAQSVVKPVNVFFEDILVMAKDPAVKASRLGVLAAVAATAPAGIDWRVLDTTLGTLF